MPKILADLIRSAVAGTDPEFRQKVVAEGATAGLWDLWEGLEALAQLYPQKPARTLARAAERLVEKAARRRPPLTRRCRWDERPQAPSSRFVRAVSLDPVLDWTLPDGATRTLQLVLSLAGGIGKPLQTLTCSIARQVGRTARTIRNHWIALEAAGWITRTLDRRTNIITVTVTEAARPPEVRSENPAPWPQPPQPKPLPNKPGWWKRYRQSREAVADVGRKFASGIKKPQESKNLTVPAPASILPNRNAVAASEDDLLAKRRQQMESRARIAGSERFGRPAYGSGSASRFVLAGLGA